MSEIEKLTKLFIDEPIEINALNLLRCLRSKNLFHSSIYIGEYILNMFPHSLDINDEIAISSYYSNNFEKAFDIHQKCLNFKGLDKDTSWKILFNQHFSINQVSDRYIYYDQEKVNQILNRKEKEFPLVTLTITTCKRYDLFEKTINSVLNCFDIDMIDRWFLVDDNSSEDDRNKMKENYPFFDFYFKTFEEKGHPQSMNIIRNYVQTPYIFHLEDDWKFFVKRNYISECLEVLNVKNNIGQCLINKNYSEIESDIDVKGGIYHTTHTGIRYFIHEFVRTDKEKEQWFKKYGHCKSSNYWPHFSFRPSLIKTKIIKELGEFNEKISHFEMDYAYKYFAKGYVSAFFEGIYSLHIGRLTSERNDESKLNAYKLNDEMQFYGKEEVLNKKEKGLTFKTKIKTFVINLDRRQDRWDKFEKENKQDLDFLKFERFSAIDGKKLKSNRQLQQIFENNDYKMRKAMVGCFMSHVKLYCDLINSDDDTQAYLFLEDDISIVPDFKSKFNDLICKLENVSWDIAFLGHHVRDLSNQDHFNKEKYPEIEKWDVYTSFVNSLGSTASYMITKDGAKKFLNFLNRTGATNGIDTCLQKSANELNVYYCSPHLIYSECFRGDNNPDSDIQYDYDNLEKTYDERLNDEILFYQENYKDNPLTKIEKYEDLLELLDKNDISNPYYFEGNNKNIKNFTKICTLPFYLIGDNIIFINTNIKDENVFFHRYKKGNKYDVELLFTD